MTRSSGWLPLTCAKALAGDARAEARAAIRGKAEESIGGERCGGEEREDVDEQSRTVVIKGELVGWVFGAGRRGGIGGRDYGCGGGIKAQSHVISDTWVSRGYHMVLRNTMITTAPHFDIHNHHY